MSFEEDLEIFPFTSIHTNYTATRPPPSGGSVTLSSDILRRMMVTIVPSFVLIVTYVEI